MGYRPHTLPPRIEPSAVTKRAWSHPPRGVDQFRNVSRVNREDQWRGQVSICGRHWSGRYCFTAAAAAVVADWLLYAAYGDAAPLNYPKYRDIYEDGCKGRD